jgi:WhiB family redox-sensing transcriptional regulator
MEIAACAAVVSLDVGEPEMVATGNWRVSANCRNGDPERLFVTGAKQREARSVCRGCPVLRQCLAHALDERIEFGVWGGMTERERRGMLRARPDVACWASLLSQAAALRSGSTQPAAAPASVETPTEAPVPLAAAVVRVPAPRAAHASESRSSSLPADEAA